MSDPREILLKRLLEEFVPSLDAAVSAHVAALSRASEWGVALEDLCNMLFEYNVPIRPRQYGLIEELGNKMEMRETCWNFLQPLVEA